MTAFLHFIDSLSTWVGKAFAWLILVLTLGDQLRGVRALRAARADHLGLRLQLHQLRRAVPDGRRLYALPQRPCPRRRALPLLAAAHAGEHGSRALHHLLPAGRRRLHVLGLELRRDVGALPGGQHLQPGRRAGLPAQGADPGDRRAAADPGHRRDHPLRAVHPARRLAAAAARRRGDRDRPSCTKSSISREADAAKPLTGHKETGA